MSAARIEAFQAMRANVVARGLLDSEHRLTDAGHDHARDLLGQLRTAEASYDPHGPCVFWNVRFRAARVTAHG